MANVTSGNPLIIDTLTATAIMASTEKFKLLAAVWTSGSLANVCSVQDAAGIVKWEVTGSVASACIQTSFTDCDLVFNGLKVPTLDTGKVYLYIKRL